MWRQTSATNRAARRAWDPGSRWLGFVHADAGRADDIRGMVNAAVEQFGRLDILVNNAHWEKRRTVVEPNEAGWDRRFDVLLKALYLGCKCAIPEMRKLRGGAIVTLSSVHAYAVSDAYVTYQTAKAGVVHFTRQVAWDFGPGSIRCNCICPGDIPPLSHVEACRRARYLPLGVRPKTPGQERRAAELRSNRLA